MKQKIGFALNPQNINRHGRPPAPMALTDLMRQILDSKPRTKKKLVEKLLDMAVNGEPAQSLMAIKLIWERLEGRPVEKIETNPEGINVSVVDYTSPVN